MVADGISVGVNVEHQQVRAGRRVEIFLSRYSDTTIADLALMYVSYAAFPLTLTTDLAYQLREEYLPDLPWYFAADLLLSGLCDPVGYDLYEMATSTRAYLLEKLIQRWHRNGLDQQQQIDRLANFLGEYILHRLSVETTDRAKQLGDPTQWLALACLRSGNEVTKQIQQELSDLWSKTEDVQERFRLADMVESVADLLLQKEGLEPIALRQLVQKLENNEPIDPLSDIRQFMETNGFPELKSEEIEYATIVFDAVNTEEELHSFEFETVTIDGTGKEVDRQNHTAYSFTESLADGVGLEMVAIPSGKFMMGALSDEKNSYDDERPQHEVTVQPFFMGQTSITQAQWRVAAGFPQVKRTIDPNPSHFKGDDLPVEKVSWEDAEEFCLRLSVYAGREWEYRLPTEAEWEYACRAGTKTPFHFGETIAGKFANYDASVVYQRQKKDKKSEGTTPVKKYLPNSFGLYDCHGNVWEWCLDDWHGDYKGAPIDGEPWFDQNANKDTFKVLRGGSWIDSPEDCRSAARCLNTRARRINSIGFRVVCSASRTLV
jgi:formylglycine-generating enzyme required for sulfatase activity